MKKVMYLSVLIMIAAWGSGFLWNFSTSGASALPPIDIVVIAKDMSFNGTNPSIVVRRGQVIRITFKNEDQPSIFHDFVIPALGLKTNILKPGESEILRFTADREGIFNYACTLHPRMMTGKFQVQ